MTKTGKTNPLCAKTGYAPICLSRLKRLKQLMAETQSGLRKDINEDEAMVSFLQDTLFKLRMSNGRLKVARAMTFMEDRCDLTKSISRIKRILTAKGGHAGAAGLFNGSKSTISMSDQQNRVLGDNNLSYEFKSQEGLRNRFERPSGAQTHRIVRNSRKSKDRFLVDSICTKTKDGASYDSIMQNGAPENKSFDSEILGRTKNQLLTRSRVNESYEHSDHAMKKARQLSQKTMSRGASVRIREYRAKKPGKSNIKSYSNLFRRNRGQQKQLDSSRDSNVYGRGSSRMNFDSQNPSQQTSNSSSMVRRPVPRNSNTASNQYNRVSNEFMSGRRRRIQSTFDNRISARNLENVDKASKSNLNRSSAHSNTLLNSPKKRRLASRKERFSNRGGANPQQKKSLLSLHETKNAENFQNEYHQHQLHQDSQQRGHYTINHQNEQTSEIKAIQRVKLTGRGVPVPIIPEIEGLSESLSTENLNLNLKQGSTPRGYFSQRSGRVLLTDSSSLAQLISSQGPMTEEENRPQNRPSYKSRKSGKYEQYLEIRERSESGERTELQESTSFEETRYQVIRRQESGNISTGINQEQEHTNNSRFQFIRAYDYCENPETVPISSISKEPPSRNSDSRKNKNLKFGGSNLRSVKSGLLNTSTNKNIVLSTGRLSAAHTVAPENPKNIKEKAQVARTKRKSFFSKKVKPQKVINSSRPTTAQNIRQRAHRGQHKALKDYRKQISVPAGELAPISIHSENLKKRIFKRKKNTTQASTSKLSYTKKPSNEEGDGAPREKSLESKKQAKAGLRKKGLKKRLSKGKLSSGSGRIGLNRNSLQNLHEKWSKGANQRAQKGGATELGSGHRKQFQSFISSDAPMRQLNSKKKALPYHSDRKQNLKNRMKTKLGLDVAQFKSYDYRSPSNNSRQSKPSAIKGPRNLKNLSSALSKKNTIKSLKEQIPKSKHFRGPSLLQEIEIVKKNHYEFKRLNLTKSTEKLNSEPRELHKEHVSNFKASEEAISYGESRSEKLEAISKELERIEKSFEKQEQQDLEHFE